VGIGGPIGVDIGVKIGLTIGQAGAADPMSGVDRDATSLIYRPSTLAQWQQTREAAGDTTGDPFLFWKLDQASGDAVDDIGALDGAPGGTLINISYEQAIPGWSAVGVTLAKGLDATFITTDASLPDTSTGDLLVMCSVRFPAAIAAGSPSTVMQLGYVYGTRVSIETMAAGPSVRAFTPSATATGAVDPAGDITPLALLVDRTSNRATVLTRFEALDVAIGGAGKAILIGGDNIQTDLSAGGTYWDLVAFSGAAARKSNAQIKAIWQACGWIVDW
jgi:hypothetical protein